MCPEGFPVAVLPLWHEAHEPATTPVWLNLAPPNDCVLWQVSQLSCVGIWLAGLTVLEREMRRPLV